MMPETGVLTTRNLGINTRPCTDVQNEQNWANLVPAVLNLQNQIGDISKIPIVEQGVPGMDGVPGTSVSDIIRQILDTLHTIITGGGGGGGTGTTTQEVWSAAAVSNEALNSGGQSFTEVIAASNFSWLTFSTPTVTIQEDGWYLIIANADFKPNSTSAGAFANIGMDILLNGSLPNGGRNHCVVIQNVDRPAGTSAHVLAELQASDTVNVGCFAVSGDCNVIHRSWSIAKVNSGV